MNHPGLAAELRPFITDGQRGAATRRLTLLIAEKCKLTELQPELLHVALDAADHPQVRSGAVSALKHCGDAGVPDLVRSLADIGKMQLIRKIAFPYQCFRIVSSFIATVVSSKLFCYKIVIYSAF